MKLDYFSSSHSMLFLSRSNLTGGYYAVGYFLCCLYCYLEIGNTQASPRQSVCYSTELLYQINPLVVAFNGEKWITFKYLDISEFSHISRYISPSSDVFILSEVIESQLFSTWVWFLSHRIVSVERLLSLGLPSSYSWMPAMVFGLWHQKIRITSSVFNLSYINSIGICHFISILTSNLPKIFTCLR